MSIQYPYVPEGRTFFYVDEHNPFMKEAMKTCMELSMDDRQPSGAVLVRDGKIVARGALQGRIKNKKIQQWHEKGLCMRKIFKVKTGTGYWICPGCAGPEFHSEQMVIKNAKKNGQETNGTDMYFWGHWWCCKPCWDKMIEAGIKDVYLLKDSERLFNRGDKNNMLGRTNFKYFLK